MKAVILLFVGIFAICISAETDWWQTAVLYQIYPRSFKDDNNDGIGDLKGITSKLQYLKDLGITATWLSPIFKSGQIDQGYDTSDYENVDEIFGTNKDLQDLIKEAKKLGIKIILDFVPNHTSDKHRWFQESVKGNSMYKDYYIWRNGPNNDSITPPNNWISNFGGIAWKYNDERKMWYYHEFAEQQPDLNYRNPDLVKDMKNILLYWLEEGVSGFRIDAVPYLFEDKQLRDEAETNPKKGVDPNDWNSLIHTYTSDLDETFDMIYQFRELIDDYNKNHTDYTRIIVTEAYSDFNKTLLYYGLNNGSRLGAHFTFNFDFIQSLKTTSSALEIKEIIDNWLTNLPKIYTHNWVVGNHDNHRVATRFGVEHVDSMMMLQSILPGVMVTYNGEEIGMEDGKVTCSEGADPQAIKNCSTFEQKSRDFERTPFQWDSTKNAGFNMGYKTWLPVSEKYKETNVALQNKKNHSHLETYKSLIEFRKKISPDAKTTTKVFNGTVLAIYRTHEAETYCFLYNRLGDSVQINIEEELKEATVLFGNSKGSSINGTRITLEKNESLILFKSKNHKNGSFLHKTQPTILFAVLFVIFFFNK